MKKILYIGNKLEKHGYAPTSADTLPPKLQDLGFRVVAISSIKNKPARLGHMLSKVLTKGQNVDVVLIDTYSTMNFWYAVACGWICKRNKIPYIFILHGGKLDERFRKSPEWIIEIFRSASANIAPSGFLLQKLNPFFSNLKLIPNWIEIEKYPYQQRSESRPSILWLRAFDQVYNPLLALETIELLRKTRPDVKLIMVGPDKDGSLNELKKIAEQKQLPVHFTGKLSKQEWLALSRDCDIFINTTNIDNTPVSLIEAMALGLPVISTNVGGIPYLIDHEENGLLVPPGDAQEMAAAICRLLNEPGLAERISENGRTKVKNFDWEQVKALWLELLD
ncbi:glycosyltransferase family 4 protein [Gramella sp. GC03-9]|uniref:Glycosyltransferase family 4 protein n=1 Tax=Christiangramia oceanisediminis TaxID=2920386 RepID=A0A9X2I6R9_9FLAO|nr:glycosyltransferase family 4 protein [Gramella oceanisediminis]MCP9198292.1 glycosyltransferase family 4 protein [Gramella oceanisediminis]